ncbi:MAG: PASTA domain-containing protein [Ignavibacteriaceae bacterium]|nr:PASTA domain-containing protein [Ignavibacteriaceae bacterium]
MLMKKILQKPIVKKILILFAVIVGFLLLLDNVILPYYVSSPETIVPNIVGFTEQAAFERLLEADLDPVISDTTFDLKYAKGTIVLQNPKADQVVKVGRRVHLYLSGGEPVVRVPSLKGKSIRDAKLSLERIGLKLGLVDELPSGNPRNMIFDQQYAEGTPLKKGEVVGVSVSIGQGGGAIVVPDLIGMSLVEAQKILADSSLTLGKINYQRSFSLLPNTILDQYPSKGNKVNVGDAIDLFVTKSGDAGDEKDNIE